jgi:hypothetical protein
MAAMAADYTGNWSGEGLADGESHPLYFVIKHSGAMVTGTGGPSAEEQHPIQNGKVVGDKISFDVDGGDAQLHFDLAPDGESLKGTVNFTHDGNSGTGTVSLKKAAS